MRQYLNKEDIIHYFQYGPMDFNFKQMIFYWLIFDLPLLIFLFFIFEVIL